MLEDLISSYLNVEYCFRFSFGRTALYATLRSIGVKELEVIVPAFCCKVVRDAICQAGGIPNFVKLDPYTFAYDIKDLRRSINSKTSCIIVIHYWGQCSPNIDEVLAVARYNDITVIEDAAHALGAIHRGKYIGTLGDAAIFSLTKGFINLGGGIAITKNADLAVRLGRFVGKNFCMTKIKRSTMWHNSSKRIGINLKTFYRRMIYFLYYDRIGTSVFKYWLIDGPQKLIHYRIQSKEKIKSTAVLQCINHTHTVLPLKMSRAIDYIARFQLAHLNNKFTKRRIEIGLKLINDLPEFCSQWTEYLKPQAHVFNYFPLTFKRNIKSLSQKAKKAGLLLRKTWPAVQNYWDSQLTGDVKWLRDHLLIWQITPLASNTELEKFVNIVHEL